MAQKTSDASTTRRKRVLRSYLAAMIPVALGINWVGFVFTQTFRIPLWLDTIGTNLVAIMAGPWIGAVIGGFNHFTEGISVPYAIPFIACGISTGFLAGFASYRGWLTSWPKVIIVALVQGLVSSTLALPVYLFLFGGASGGTSDVIAFALTAAGTPLAWSVWVSNYIVTGPDRVITMLLALLVIRALPKEFTLTTPFRQK
jgi:energy-coupling factor transport system substrate-specific component